jgi:hypothetical protein
MGEEEMNALRRQLWDAREKSSQVSMNWKCSKQHARDYLAAKERELALARRLIRLYPEYRYPNYSAKSPQSASGLRQENEGAIRSLSGSVSEIRAEIPRIKEEYHTAECLDI